MKERILKEVKESVRGGRSGTRGTASPSGPGDGNKAKVRQIRVNYRLSQRQFASLLGISVATLQNWEQGRRSPKGAARVLLMIAARHPEMVWDVVKPVVEASRGTKGVIVRSTAKFSTQVPTGLKPHFQEYDLEALNISKDANLIIQRTLQFGTWDELRWLFGVYGRTRIQAFLRQYGERWLRPVDFNYWRKLLGIRKWRRGPLSTPKGQLWNH